MKVLVDPEKCQGHGRCAAVAPELFHLDDYGQSSVMGDGTVAADHRHRARLAAANCPEYAIVLIDS